MKPLDAVLPFRAVQLQNLPIGRRLRLVFACILGLMLFGSTISWWYLRDVRQHLERASAVERRMTAILQLDNSVLSLMNQLHRAADTERRDYFAAQAVRLLDIFRSDTAWAAGALQATSTDSKLQAIALDSLHELLNSLPARVQGMIELAENDDWTVLHARLMNDVDHTDDVVAALVREIDTELAAARQRLLSEVQQAQKGAAQILAATGCAGFLAAAFLGILVTRSITRPLASLGRAAQALARGDFAPNLAIAGNDELANLGAVFNQTAQQLDSLYGQLRLSEAHFRSLIENAAELIVVVDRTGHVTYASPSSTRMLGYPPELLLGQPMQELVHPDMLPAAQELFGSASRDPSWQPESFELRFRHQDGSYRIFEGVVTRLFDDPAVRGLVVNARDVSDRRMAEEVLREREEQLRQAQKMEAVGRLAGGVAHDFNNLLTVINGYSELLLDAIEERDSRRRHVEDIRGAGEQAVELTRQLLAFSRKQILQPQVLNLNEIVREVERMLRRLISEDITLTCNLDPAIGMVEADRHQIHQVLLNLCVNARDAMPQGGDLTICTTPVDGEAVAVRTALPASGWVRLSVTDTGLGMDEETRERIFEPFFTTKGQGRGTGLGLATVYGIIRQTGGQIRVSSAPGRGSSFHIDLPTVDRTAEKAESVRPEVPARGTETILVVEDQREVRQFAVSVLGRCGYRVMEAESGPDALRLSAETAEPIQALVTDVVMPNMNGVELSKQLLAQRPEMRVIFVSGYADSVLLRHGVLETGAMFLPKPYTVAALTATVRAALDAPRKAS